MTYAELFNLLGAMTLEAHAAALPAEEGRRNELRAALALMLEPPEVVIQAFEQGSEPWNWTLDTPQPSLTVSLPPETPNPGS